MELHFENKENVSAIKSTVKSDYVSPSIRNIPLRLENALCGSPLPGGNEDIGYDDW